MSERPDPYEGDPLGWGASMAHHAEVILACLEATRTTGVVEIGAYAGGLTRRLADWAAGTDRSVVAIDPAPQPALRALAEERAEVRLIEEPSLRALEHVELPEVVIVDGDHNHHTVLAELRAIAARKGPGALPLLLLHDVCWPHGRRDDYYDPDAIPAEHRHPLAGEQGIAPGEPGVRPDGLPYPRSAAREGGPANGVLTAAEDFAAEQEGVELAVVPAFFGLGALWRRQAPWAADVAGILQPLDRHELLARLEENRLRHIAEAHALRQELWRAREAHGRQEALLRRMLESSAFGVAERLSRLRTRAGIAPNRSTVSREEIRRVLSLSRLR